jgi:hypothetical protein
MYVVVHAWVVRSNHALAYIGRRQGDQIGRIFAQWVIVYFGQFLENYRSSPNFGVTFSPGKG